MIGGLVAVAALVVVALTAELRWRRPAWWGPEPWRAWCARAGLVILIGAFTISALGARSGLLWLETLQFCLVLFGATPLLVMGGPALWRRAASGARPDRLGARVAEARWWGLAGGSGWTSLAIYMVVLVFWRLPASVDAVGRTPALVIIEALTLVAGGWWLWRDVLGDAEHVALYPRPRRMAFAAFGMWAAWIVAYVLGFSGASLYPAFAGGHGVLGAIGDQQLATVVLWVAAGAGFAPVVFVNLARWLDSDAADPASSGRVRSGRHSRTETR